MSDLTHADDSRRVATIGTFAALGGYGLWGVAVILYKMLGHISPFEILAHRAIWSVVVMGLLILALRRADDVWRALRNPRLMGLLAFTSLLIGANWLVFIWSVAEGRIVEASLGYYINPLISVLLGVWLLSERLSKAQIVSVALAATAVAILTAGLGAFPWIALFLAVTFAIYGYLRKTMAVDALAGLGIEVLYLMPFGFVFLLWVTPEPGGAFVTATAATKWLLIAAGPMTVVPLLLFNIGARRVRLATLGLLQYTAPTINFLLAVFVYGEELTATHLIAFGLIWAALGIFSFDTLRTERELRRVARV